MLNRSPLIDLTLPPTSLLEHLLGEALALDVHTHGFELIARAPTALTRADFAAADASRVTGAYYDEISALVRTRLGAARVVCYSHKVRLSPAVDFAAGASRASRHFAAPRASLLSGL